MSRLFGTDGVRGHVGSHITARLAFELGAAGALVLTKSHKNPTMLIGADTRISSDMLVAALAAGACSVGVNVHNAGIIPTSAVAHLIKKYGMAAGVMVSASHNAYADNGIKFYDAFGHKLSDDVEDEIEKTLSASPTLAQSNSIGRIYNAVRANEDYVDFLTSIISTDLSSKNIALDCANGATIYAAPAAFKGLGANVFAMAIEPNGVNINADCGSTHIEALQKHVISVSGSPQKAYDMAFAFDGDGDRCFALDENANVLDGDMLMSIIATHWQKKGLLAKGTVVATVMSNLGFFMQAKNSGFDVLQADVGDRYVLKEMIKGGYNLGGEQSGHLICLDHHTTGDGILTALIIASIVQETGKKLSQLNTMIKLPQVLINAKIDNSKKEMVLADHNLKAEINALEKSFDGRGRVLIRPSGTEPLIRVMIEGENLEEITKEAKRVAAIMEDLQ